jgi:hypothetical protein
MSAIDNLPTNENFLSPLGFKFQIKKTPGMNFFVQRVNLPGMSIPDTGQPNPFVKIPLAGDHIEFEPLQVTFKVDEILANYLEIHNWLRGLGFPDEFRQYKDLSNKPIMSGLGLTSDISLLVLSSAKNPTFDVVFRDAHPIGLTSLTFDTTDPDVNYLTATATFKYLSYSINPA